MIAGHVTPPPTADVPERRYRQFPRAAVSIWQVENLVGVLAAVAVALAVFHGPFAPSDAGPWELVLVGVIAVVGLVESLVLIPRRYASHRYALLDDSLVIERGRILARRLVFPFSQILYVETHQGPVLRRYGLFRVRIGTIAEPHTFGPLPKVVAEEIERLIEVRTRAD